MIRRLCLCLFAALATRIGAATVDIQILCTTDLHAWLEKTERYADGGGWLRLATVIQEQRQQFGPERTLLLDCGDTTQGTLLGLLSNGQASVEMLKALKYDVWVPGNHEFDFGVRRAYEICNQLRDMLLCANLEFIHAGKPERFPPWRLFERGGARIAVIGATASYMEQWLWGHAAEGYKAEKAVPVLARLVPEIQRQQPDLIILAIHQGWMIEDPRQVNEVADIVKRFPEIDLVLGGHTHRDLPGLRVGARTWYVQAGYGAGHVAVVKAKLDTDTHTVLDMVSELRDAPSRIAPDPVAQKAVHKHLDSYRRAARQPVAQLTSAVPATGTAGETCAVSDLFCRAFIAATGADVAFHGKLSPKAGLPQGDVTAEDIFGVVPFENSIGVATVSVAELKTIVEEQLKARESLSYNGIYGLEIRATRDGRITALRYADGRDVPADARFRLTMNSYVVAGGGGRFPLLRQILRTPEAKLRDTGINSRDAVTDFLTRNPGLDLKPRRWLYLEAGGTPPPTPPVRKE